MGLLSFERLKNGLKKTREALLGQIQKVIALKPVLDADLLSQLEETLLAGDVGIATTETLIRNLRLRLKQQRINSAEQITQILKSELEKLFPTDGPSETPGESSGRPHIVMVVGVNGVGKTTTIGKLAYLHRSKGRKVVIAAADTFRAASNEQLEIWAERAGVRMVQQSRGADPAAVAFDALKSAISEGEDLLLIDTAGRLHTKTNLMEELKKVKRVLEKQMPGTPHEVLLVIDATTGQNGLTQARQFSNTVGVTGVVLTKLDGTAKGGIVFSISNELQVPVRYVGVGEGIDDLQPFDKSAFVEALFGN